MGFREISAYAGRIRSEEVAKNANATVGLTSKVQPGQLSSVTYPIPYFGVSGTDWWQMDVIRDDNTNGKTCTMYWRIPADTFRLEVTYRYLKKDGSAYNQKYHWTTSEITDSDRANGFFVWTQDGLHPTRKLDIVKAVAHLGRKNSKDTATNPPNDGPLQDNPPPAGNDAVIAGAPWNGQGGYRDSIGAALARIVSGPYILSLPRITAVGSPIKDTDGIWFPVTFTYTANTCHTLTIRYTHVGVKVAAGTTDLTKYGGHKHEELARLTDAEQSAGTCVRNVGPFTTRQAKKTWHILRVSSITQIDTLAGVQHEHYPADLATISQNPTDTSHAWSAAPIPGRDTIAATPSPENPNGANAAAMLAILAQIEDIAGTVGGFNLTTAADATTEKDDDAYVEWLGTIKDPTGANTITAQDANATEVELAYMRNNLFTGVSATDQPHYHHDRVALDPTDTTFSHRFDKRIGHKYKLIKVTLLNPVSKARLALTGFTGGAVTGGVFIAGQTNGAYREPDAHTGIGSVVLSDADVANVESNKAHIKCSIANNGVGGVPVIPKTLLVYVSRKQTPLDPGAIPTDDPTSGDWRLEKQINLKSDHGLVTIGTVTRTFAVKLRRHVNHWIRVRLYVVGDATPVDSTSLLYTTTSEMPVQHKGHGRGNQILGGGFTASKQDAGLTSSIKPARDWEYWSDDLGTIAADIDTNSANPVWWDKVNRCLVWKYNGGAPYAIACHMYKHLIPGKTYSTSIRARSHSGSTNSILFTVAIAKKGVGLLTTVGLVRSVLLNSNGGSFLSLVYTGMNLGAFTNGGNDIYVLLRRAGSGTQDIDITDVMMVLGGEAMPFEPAGIEASWNSDTGTSVTYTDTAAANYTNASGSNDPNVFGSGDYAWEF